jgi:hypothetical protein
VHGLIRNSVLDVEMFLNDVRVSNSCVLGYSSVATVLSLECIRDRRFSSRLQPSSSRSSLHDKYKTIYEHLELPVGTKKFNFGLRIICPLCRTGGRCRASLLPEYRGRIVVQGCYRCLRYIALCRDDVWVHNSSGQFGVAGTRGVGVTD